jgi:hypothetical protein
MVNYLQEGKPQADQGTMNRLTLSEDQWLTRMPSLIPRHSWIVVLSDFLDWPIQDEQSSFAKVVHYLATHGRLTSLYIQDHHEVALLQALHPIPVRDSESQQTYWLYVNHSEWRQDYSRANDERIGTQQNRLRKLGPVLTLDTRMPLSECVHRFLGLILPQSDRIPGIPSNAARLSDA